MKIYVVTEGEYSGYHIEIVTPSREIAEKYVEKRKDIPYHSRYCIEEYETDIAEKYICEHRSLWRVWEMKNGDIRVDNPIDAFDPEDYDDVNRVWRTCGCDPWIGVDVLADNKEKATKMAVDLFTAYKAKQKGCL